MQTVRMVLAGLLVFWLTPGSAGTGVVRTAQGDLEGVAGRSAGITVFRGVPYAAPPTGELRWRAPQPPGSWSGIRRADRFSPSCIQTIVNERKPWTHEFMSHDTISEDCLYLNIWTPAKRAGARLPVLIYIHGGGFSEGSGSVAVYDGEGLARQGVVMVTINYRLGVFGFLAHPELTKESGVGASGNYGLLDCLAALKWVRQNIAAFGGDPGQVTIAGQSAGSMAVHALVASPLARGLFRRAIAESGGTVVGGPVRRLADGEQDGLRFAERRGADSLAALRAMSPSQLTAPLPTPTGAGTAAIRFAMIVDGHLLPASIDEIVARGEASDVPFLAGGNADEGGATPNPTTTLEAFRNSARQRFNATEAAEFLRLYPAENDREAGQVANEAARDQLRSSIANWAQVRRGRTKSRLYTYFWNHALPGPDAAKYGAFHTSEVPYALNTLEMSDRPFTEEDRRIAATMSGYWAGFAKSGNPNGGGRPHWPAVDERPEATMQIGDRNIPIPLAGSAARLGFWRDWFTRQRQPATAGR